MEYEVRLKWKAGSSHQLPDALLGFHLPGPPCEKNRRLILRYTTSSLHGVFMGPQEPTPNDIRLKDMDTLQNVDVIL